MTAGRRNQPRPKDAAEQGSVVAVAVGVRACERERERGRREINIHMFPLLVKDFTLWTGTEASWSG